VARQFLYGQLFNVEAMTTLENFKEATFEEKCTIVTAEASYLMSRSLGNCKVYLYHAPDFFIEVYYSPVYKKVLMINAFNELAGLMPYAEMVSLADLTG
jgi:hypothetical protein